MDAERHAKTNATLSVAIDEWLKTLEVEESTREAYEIYAQRYIKPALGKELAGKVSARVLEQFMPSFADAGRGATGDRSSSTESRDPTSAGRYGTAARRVGRQQRLSAP